MAECNDRPVNGIPVGDGRDSSNRSEHSLGENYHGEREQYRNRGYPRRQQTANRTTGVRGYRTTDRQQQQQPLSSTSSQSQRLSRWDNNNNNNSGQTTHNNNNRDGRRDGDDYDGESDRRRRGTAADKRIDIIAGVGESSSSFERNEDNSDRNFPSSRGNNDYRDRGRGGGSSENEYRSRRDGNRDDDQYNNKGRRRGVSRYRDDGDDNRDRGDGDTKRYGNRRERSDSGYRSEEYGDSRRDSRFYERSRGRSSFDRSDRRRRHSKNCTSDYDGDGNNNSSPEETNNETHVQKEPKEWPPSFQKDGSAFTFDVRSAMFYEPLSDFFYDPKSKLYYGNTKCAYFRYDEKKDPHFVEVQKMTTKQVEEQKRGDSGALEKVAIHTPAATVPSKPKIAIRFKTKKVKSSVSILSSRECDNHQPANKNKTNTVSKAKQQQIAIIGKWNEIQAELKESVPNANAASETVPQTEAPPPQPKIIRTTNKGLPICLVCKRKFPNLAKLRLHEKGSELHKKNLLALQEKRKKKQELAATATVAVGTKRKLDVEKTTSKLDLSANNHQASETTTMAKAKIAFVYTDRAEKRRQLHGTDLCAPALSHGSIMQQFHDVDDDVEAPSNINIPGADLLDKNNVGHKMLQKMGYNTADQQQLDHTSSNSGESSNNNNSKQPKTANEHLRKEWDRIEAMAQKSIPRKSYYL